MADKRDQEPEEQDERDRRIAKAIEDLREAIDLLAAERCPQEPDEDEPDPK